MGQGESRFEQMQRLYQDYKQITPLENTFSECIVLQNKKNGGRLLLREINLTDEIQFKKAIQQYESRQKLTHANFLNIQNHFYRLDQQLCGQFFKIFLLFESPGTTLGTLTNASEQEMVNYLKQCIEGLRFMQEHQIQHNGIQLQSLYFLNDDLKVSDPMYFGQQTNFMKIIQNPYNHEYLYLSPVLVKAIIQNNWQPKHNSFKSDVFTLGMSFLHFALGEPSSDCYLYEQGKFFEDKLESKVRKLKVKYSPQLTDIISQMLITNEDLRPDFIRLSSFLKQDIRGRQTTYRVLDTTQSRDNSQKPTKAQFFEQQQVPQQPIQYQQQFSNSNTHQHQQIPQQFVQQLSKVPQKQISQHFSQLSGLSQISQQQQIQPPPPSSQARRIQQICQIAPLEYVHQYAIKTDSSTRSLTPISQSSKGIQIQNLLNKDQRDTSQPRYRDSRHDSRHNSRDLISRDQISRDQISRDQINQSRDSNQSYLHEISTISTRNQAVQQFFPPRPAQKPQPPQAIPQPPAQLLIIDKPDQIFTTVIEPLKAQIPIIDENSDPMNEEDGQNIVSQRGEFLRFSKILQDSTNMVQNQTFKSDLKDYSAVNRDYLSQNQNLNQNQNQKQDFSLPYDLPVPQFKKLDQNAQYTSFQNDSGSKSEYVIEHYSNGSRHGQGKFYYQDGGLYDGGWKANQMHGQGTLYYSTGQPAYQGDWFEDQFQGYGTLYNERPMQLEEPFDYKDFDNVEDFWIKYSGNFEVDNKEGQGTLYLTNGERFVGTFERDFHKWIWYILLLEWKNCRWKMAKQQIIMIIQSNIDNFLQTQTYDIATSENSVIIPSSFSSLIAFLYNS
ncbi:hypothetical protein pb186bvf_001102 [Paramecium bursaria]